MASNEATARKLNSLRLILGDTHVPVKKDFWPAPALESGIPRGVLVELLGPARTEWVIQFLNQLLAKNPEYRIFWAEKEQSILPTALEQRGLKLKNVTFGTFGKDLLQPLRRVLQSQSFQVVLAPNLFEEIRIFQAFQLFAEKSNSTLFLFGDKTPATAWPISLQLEIHHDGNSHTSNQFMIEILRQKHGKLAYD